MSRQTDLTITLQGEGTTSLWNNQNITKEMLQGLLKTNNGLCDHLLAVVTNITGADEVDGVNILPLGRHACSHRLKLQFGGKLHSCIGM